MEFFSFFLHKYGSNTEQFIIYKVYKVGKYFSLWITGLKLLMPYLTSGMGGEKETGFRGKNTISIPSRTHQTGQRGHDKLNKARLILGPFSENSTDLQLACEACKQKSMDVSPLISKSVE